MGSQQWFEKDYYKILGVAKDAKPEQIKKAFRKIARDNHPDQHPGDKAAEQRFKEASEAHDILSDPQKRREYDQHRSLLGGAGGFGPGFKFQRGASSPEDFLRTMGREGSITDIFGNLFSGAGNHRTASRPGADLSGSVTITFEQSLEGATVAVPLSSDRACGLCHGTGAKPGSSTRACPTCQGSGIQQATSMSDVFSIGEPCRDCGGRGLIVDDPCGECQGSGRSRSQRTIQVRIPAGVTDGQKIRVRGRGQAGIAGGRAGDLLVTVHVQPHPIFGRSGDHLTITLPITFAEAALGAEVQVPTLNSSPVTVRIPAGTPSGRTLRVRGRGVAKKSGRGDLLVTVEVQVPTQLNHSAQEALKAYVAAADEPNPRADLGV